jgi:tetratricopeptide (TPR) repeat protein
MNSKELQKDFLPKEIVLKLMLDIPRGNYAEKLALLDNYIDQVKDSFEPDILLVKSNNEKGLIYWDAKKYDLAIRHYEKVLEILGPSDYPFLYFHITYLLITCYRLTKQFGPSMQWAETALNNLDCTNSSFDKLITLTAYADLLAEAGLPFNERNTALIDIVIQELEFPSIPVVEPIERIKIISQEHKRWNQQLSKLHLIPRENKAEIIAALKDYVASCEIGWYKKYAAQRLKRIENAS